MTRAQERSEGYPIAKGEERGARAPDPNVRDVMGA
jgi:hypothetical protein